MGASEESGDGDEGGYARLTRRARRAQRSAERARRRALRRAEALRERSPHKIRQAWTLVERTTREVIDDRVLGLAAEVALFTVISLPALLLMVLGSLGFLADALGPEAEAELQRIVFELPRSVLSEQTYSAYADLAIRVLQDGRADVVSVGAIVAVWTGSRAANRYLETVTIAYGVPARVGWRRRLLAFGLTFAGILSAIAVLPLLVLGPDLVQALAPAQIEEVTLQLLGRLYWPFLGLVVVCALATLFHVGVPWRTPWRRDLPGALLAMVLWVLAAAALRAYLALSARDDAVYSQLGTPIAVVLWLYVTAFAVLLGAELNAEIEKMWPHEDHPWRIRQRTRNGIARLAARVRERAGP